jgi:hypothetical protein
MASKFLMLATENDKDEGRVFIRNFDFQDFKGAGFKEEIIRSPEASGSSTPKGLTEVSFTEKSAPILVPSSRSDMEDVIITIRKLSTTMDRMLETIENLKNSILLIENNNNVSDSDMKKFIETTINRSLEHLGMKNLAVEDLENNDVILFVKNPPSKQMIEISNSVAEDILKKSKCYITGNQNNLSGQLREVRQLKILEMGESKFSRNQRVKINFLSESESESEDDDVTTQMFGSGSKDEE